MTDCYNSDQTSAPILKRPFVSQWLLERALKSVIRRGTLHLRLPDGTSR